MSDNRYYVNLNRGANVRRHAERSSQSVETVRFSLWLVSLRTPRCSTWLVSLLLDKITRRSDGICLYGIAPPKAATASERLAEIAAMQTARIKALQPDGLIVYDLQDESERNRSPRPFPFLPTIDPDEYADRWLANLDVPKIVYRSVGRFSPESLGRWAAAPMRGPRFTVLVGASTSRGAERPAFRLDDAYAVLQAHAHDVVLGGIAIAERHGVKGDEHARLIAKAERGCRFFVTQAVYDVTSTKSLLSDYHYALRARDEKPVPIILTFSPCGSQKTLALLRWLGVSIPRWLENELVHHGDILGRSVDLCDEMFDEILAFARAKDIPIGINVESVSISRAEIEASTELFTRLQRRLARGV
jgi:hypothetical protein